MPRGIPEEIVDEIRQRSDLADLVGEYIALEKKGKSMLGLCPFHSEKTPSFSVSPEKQLFYCFGCGASGNVFSFVMKMENMDFSDAARFLAGRAGIRIPERRDYSDKGESWKEQIYELNMLAARFFAHHLWKTAAGKKIVEYLQERGISRDASEMFMLGYAPPGWQNLVNAASKKGVAPEMLLQAGLVSAREGGGVYDRFRNRLVFPIFNLGGKVVGFGGRALEEGEKAGPKYLNTPETAVFEKGSVLYGLHLAREQVRRDKTAVVVEGYTDVIAAHQAGLKNVIASQGTALTPAQARLMRSQAENVVIAYDADSAGEAATWRGLQILKDAGCMVRVTELPPGSDPDSLIREKGVDSFIELVGKARPLVEYQLAKLKERHGVESAEGRIKFTREALALLHQVTNLVERDYYLKLVAEELGISEAALRGELKKHRQKAKGVNNLALKDQTNNINYIKVSPAEKLLVSLIIQDSEINDLVNRELDIEDIEHELTRQIIAAVHKLESAGAAVTAEGLIDHFSEPRVHAFITKAATDPSLQDLSSEKIKRMAGDCIEKIKQRKLVRQRQELQNRLRAMEKEGLNEQARNLLLEQWQMILNKTRSPYRSGGGEDFHG